MAIGILRLDYPYKIKYSRCVNKAKLKYLRHFYHVTESGINNRIGEMLKEIIGCPVYFPDI